MEKYTKTVLILAFCFAAFVRGLEGRDIKVDPKPNQPQIPGDFGGFSGGSPIFGGGFGFEPGFGLGQRVYGGAFPGFGSVPGFPGGAPGSGTVPGFPGGVPGSGTVPGFPESVPGLPNVGLAGQSADMP